MSYISSKIRNLSKAFVDNLAEKEPREWPPKCIVLTYQPERPANKTKEESSKAVSE